jgi:hypothetical protein
MSDPNCIEGPVKPPPVHHIAGLHHAAPVHHGFLPPVHHLPRYIRIWAVSACSVAGASGALAGVTLVVRHWPIEHALVSRHVYETQVEPLFAVPEPSSISMLIVGLIVLFATRRLFHAGWKMPVRINRRPPRERQRIDR